jgi:hypothetical protein
VVVFKVVTVVTFLQLHFSLVELELQIGLAVFQMVLFTQQSQVVLLAKLTQLQAEVETSNEVFWTGLLLSMRLIPTQLHW